MPTTRTTADIQNEIQAALKQIETAQSRIKGLTAEPVVTKEDAIAAEVAKAKAREKKRVELQGVKSAVSVLETQVKEAQDELKQATEAEDRARVEAATQTAISELEALQQPLDDAVATLLSVVDQINAVKSVHNADVRAHLAYIRADDEFGRGKRPGNDGLLANETLIALPKLVRKNGAGGNPLRYYGDLFSLESTQTKANKES
ncbi:MAG: hypothetical protein AAGL17_04010 [Cyanobacteria bacterium J06576_12]